MTASRRRRLELNGAQLERLGRFLMNAGRAHALGSAGRLSHFAAQEEWQLMDSVSRAAVIRLGLRPKLTSMDIIPAN